MSVEMSILAYCNNPEGITNCSGSGDPSCPLKRLIDVANKSSAGTLGEFWNTETRSYFGDEIQIKRRETLDSNFVFCQRFHGAVGATTGLAVLSINPRSNYPSARHRTL